MRKGVLVALLLAALIGEATYLSRARALRFHADPLAGARAYAGPEPARTLGSGTTSFDLVAPAGVNALRVELHEGLVGARVDATGVVGTERVVLMHGHRIGGRELVVLWDHVRYDRIEVIVHNDLRHAPTVSSVTWYAR